MIYQILTLTPAYMHVSFQWSQSLQDGSYEIRRADHGVEWGTGNKSMGLDFFITISI